MFCEKEYIGKKIKEYRRKKKFSQAELAEKVGLSDKHIGRIEAGRFFPTFLNFLKILKILDISLSEFGLSLDENLSNEREEFLKLIYGLSEKEVISYLKIIKVLKKEYDNRTIN